MCKDKNLTTNLFLKNNLPIKLILFFICFGCENLNQKQIKINSQKIKIKIERFDRVFDTLNEYNISKIKQKYSFLFPSNYKDSFWIKKSNDTIYELLVSEVNNKFEKIDNTENKISQLLKHIKYEFNEIEVPRVISIINNVDYGNRLILNDKLLLISIDSYLGFDNKLYYGIPNFIKKTMDINYISSDIAEKYAQKLISKPSNRDFLSKMIYYGKQLYFKDIVMPYENDEIKIGYLEEEIKWVKENELFIWQYMIEKQILYNTDQSLEDRFLLPSPFTKFYLEIDNDSPSRIGQWIGWQIVKSFSKQFPDYGLNKILKVPEHEIFKKSKYKPRRIWQ